MKLVALLLLALCAGELRAESSPQLAGVSDKAWKALPSHPRLFADAVRWKILKERIASDEVSRQLFAVVRDTATRLLDQPPVAYVDKGAFWHGPMRQAQGRILSLAMMFRLTGEARFLTRAKLEMKTMAELPNWYPQHFLDTAEGALGMAVGMGGRLNGNGITIDGRKADDEKKPRPHHITLRDLRIWGCPGGGISAIQSDYITVEDCTVSGCAWYSTFACSGISVWQAWAFDQEPGHHIRILRNRCFDNRQYLPGRADGPITDGNGIIVDDSRNTQQGSKLGPYTGRILIQGNVCSQNGGSGIHTYESDHVDILDNVLWLNSQTPAFNNGQIFVNDSSDIRIAGNMLTAPEGKPATGNFKRADRPANEGIVWADNILLGCKPGKDTEDGNAAIALPRPVAK